MRPRLTYSNVVSTLCLFLLLGGGRILRRRSVGQELGREQAAQEERRGHGENQERSDHGRQSQKRNLTGSQINVSTLGTVPTAQTAQTASSVTPPEAWHMVGAPGEPGFENGWANAPPALPLTFEGAGFYKDHEGVVHLKGLIKSGASGGGIIFHLPTGYRPASGKALFRFTFCGGAGCPETFGPMLIIGPGVAPGGDGAVLAPSGAITTSLEGISFRAES
jgi:hypothetical protein